MQVCIWFWYLIVFALPSLTIIKLVTLTLCCLWVSTYFSFNLTIYYYAYYATSALICHKWLHVLQDDCLPHSSQTNKCMSALGSDTGDKQVWKTKHGHWWPSSSTSEHWWLSSNTSGSWWHLRSTYGQGGMCSGSLRWQWRAIVNVYSRFQRLAGLGLTTLRSTVWFISNISKTVLPPWVI